MPPAISPKPAEKAENPEKSSDRNNRGKREIRDLRAEYLGRFHEQRGIWKPRRKRNF